MDDKKSTCDPWCWLTHEVRDVTQQPYEQEAHGQAIGTLGFVVGNKLWKLPCDTVRTTQTFFSVLQMLGQRSAGGKASTNQQTYPSGQAYTAKHPRQGLPDGRWL